jgi:putative Mn2+ efflux pump MntP
MKHRQTPAQLRIKNLSYATLSGQAGCVTLIIVFAALFIGIWLDSLIGRRGPFTIGLLVLSIPVSLYLMLRIALGAVERIAPPSRKPADEVDHDQDTI